MNALIRFNIYYYFKTNRYLVPFVLHFIFLYFIYGSGNIPLQEGYILTTISIFLCSFFIGFVIIDSEPVVIQKLFVLHYRIRLKKFYLTKILTVGLIASLLIVLNILCPIFLFGNFQADVMITALGIQISTAISGGVLAMFLSKKMISDRILAIIFAFVIVVLSLSATGIRNMLPDYLHFILYLLPPVHLSIKAITEPNLSDVFFPCIYAIVITTIWINIISKRSF
ncbi:hypothetical protein J7E78_25435 [Paenibacillus polymyxa]|uniref:hypothetical protein n=1 Tax=Paenibacillus polymyxa TaxID=1406 RepID=UPI001BEC0607|nr:hypothetical protein [Paenibacillus polymyxa]MBT2286869.1 hypothetical protein [Paenibacillus polymyxa]